MTATFQLDQLTVDGRRFASVTVAVAAASAPVVTVEAQADDGVRGEAAHGAREALNALGRDNNHHRVTVTGIGTTGDTGVGDVYEATARAVWQAVRPYREPFFGGFTQPEMVTAWLRDRIGRRLTAVTEASYWYRGSRRPGAAGLVHAWLHFDGRPPTWLHGRGDDLLLAIGDPYPAFRIDEYGEVRIAPAQDQPAVGRRLVDAALFLGPSRHPSTAGLHLRWDAGADLIIGTVGDGWILDPDEVPDAWSRQPWLSTRVE